MIVYEPAILHDWFIHFDSEHEFHVCYAIKYHYASDQFYYIRSGPILWLSEEEGRLVTPDMEYKIIQPLQDIEVQNMVLTLCDLLCVQSFGDETHICVASTQWH